MEAKQTVCQSVNLQSSCSGQMLTLLTFVARWWCCNPTSEIWTHANTNTVSIINVMNSDSLWHGVIIFTIRVLGGESMFLSLTAVQSHNTNFTKPANKFVHSNCVEMINYVNWIHSILYLSIKRNLHNETYWKQAQQIQDNHQTSSISFIIMNVLLSLKMYLRTHTFI